LGEVLAVALRHDPDEDGQPYDRQRANDGEDQRGPKHARGVEVRA